MFRRNYPQTGLAVTLFSTGFPSSIELKTETEQ